MKTKVRLMMQLGGSYAATATRTKSKSQQGDTWHSQTKVAQART